ncbi:hypothetical protein F5876DRAFT_82597 [Lentinula aff. lateritia]|uniref:Uncharacterized protein n=1 Tax=Lentinula aff. lateritia TaxID=2804960 RepID=A0ACC1TJB5_9AGAR|nr:hypothetical protein F5876DRAFT_82597 [Lentinula aff. lateritia]
MSMASTRSRVNSQFPRPYMEWTSATISPALVQSLVADMEMVFNKMANGNGTNIHPIQVDDGLLQRCSFWESLGALTGQ